MCTIEHRVAYLFEQHAVSGAENSALELFRRLDGGSIALIPYTTGKGPLTDALFSRGFSPHFWKKPREEARERALADALRRNSIDLIHANTMQLGRLTGRLSLLSGIPSVAHVREFGTLNKRNINNLKSNRALIAVSRAVKENLRKQGVPAELIHVIYNGVSAPHSAAEKREHDIRAELELAPHAPLVVWAGQITLRKDPETFLRVAEMILRHSTGAHFLLLGDCFGMKEETLALKDRLVENAGKPPLAGNMHLLGWRDDACSIIRQATVLLHTALQEPLGRVLLESMAAGTPVVATDVGGTGEAVGPCALLVQKGDAKAMASEVVRLLDSTRLRDKLVQKGREHWKRFFQPEVMAENIARIWKQVIANDQDRTT